MPNIANLSPKSDDLNISDDEAIYVITRTGKKELLDTNKIVKRLKQLINRAPKIQHVNPYDLMLKVTPGLKSYITTSEIDEYTADAAASLSLSNPYYMKLASRIAVDNHQKNTDRSFTDKMRKLYLYTNHKGEHTPLVGEEFYKYVEEHQDLLEDTIDYTRDFLIDYFGFRTFERSYSMRIDDKIIDRPQDLYMRTAVALHMNVNTDTAIDLANIVEHYNYLSTKSLTQASPTYFNAGTDTPQYASCFLKKMPDSIHGIYKCNADCAKISKEAGGIGIHVHSVRSNGAPIRGKGKSKGLVPWLRCINTTMEAVDQGGRRPGAAAIYLMPHHPDIMAFLSLKNKDGTDKDRARELFYSLWTPDIFMERVKAGAIWSLFDPHETEDLSDYYDADDQAAYTNKYLELEEKKLYKRQIPARDVWEKHIESNQDNGGPYLCFSDNANRMNMQKNIGVVKSSNLCVTADTKVLTREGYLPIIECDGKDVLVPMSDDTFLVDYSFEKAKLLNQGIKQVFEIKFKSSQSLKATEDHPVLIVTGRNKNTKQNYYQWKKVKNLNVGDKIYMPNNDPLPEVIPIKDLPTLDTEYAVLGWLIGDGVYNKGNIGAVFGATEKHAQEVVTEQLNEWKSELPRLKCARDFKINCTAPRKCACQSISQSKPLYAFMKEEFGFKEAKAPNKEIPTAIFNSTFEQKAAFLSGLFSADGCIMENRHNKPHVRYSSASYKLTIQIQLMLKEFGIHARYAQYNHTDGRTWYNMSIEGCNNIDRFRDYINFVLSPTKLEKLNAYNLDELYVNDRLATDYVKVDEIIKLNEEPVYDLSLKNRHVFITNGLAIHNCAEIYLYSDENEYSTCNLCSLSLSSCVFDSYTKEELKLKEDNPEGVRELDHEFPINPYFDFDKLQKLTEISVININNIIDKTMYPVKETRRSNMRHRPIGIGVQGLADAYLKMRYPFDSELARTLNKKIFETIYYAALAKSSKICRVAYTNYAKECKDKGEVFVETYVQDNYKKHLVRFTDPKTIPKTIGAYPSMLWNGGAPISKGTFHWELAGLESKDLSGMYDWESLREHIKTYGVRNSVLVALMPTASTSQFLGNNECIEPFTTNIYKRKTLAGEFIVINKYLIHDMFRLGIWNNNIKEYLLALNGSIQAIDGIPQDLKDLYKTAYELNPEEIIQQAIDRQPFVDQGQSLNWYIEDLTNKLYTKLAFKAWRGKLKTAKYYLHTRPAVDAQKFTIDPTKQKEMNEKLESEKNKRDTKFLEPKEEVCLVCSA